MDLIEDVAHAATPEDVLCSLERHVANRDVLYLSHRTLVAPLRTVTRATTPKDWLEYYDDNEYFRLDPGIARLRFAKVPLPISFDPGHRTYLAEGRARTMFAEMTSFDARGSFFVPFHERPDAPAASVNFLTSTDKASFDVWLEAHAEALKLYAVIAHTRISELTRPDRPEDTPEPPLLAPRERECLQWLAAGLKSDRIAERMGISHRTVEFHFRNARKKLGASTREHALAKALIDGLIER